MGNEKAICDVKINIHFKYDFVALWRPFWDYSNFIFSQKQLSNIEPQITSSEEKNAEKLFFFFFLSLLPKGLSAYSCQPLLKRVWLHE